MADLQDLDLLNPGKLWATAEHQKDVPFHVCCPDDGVTKVKFKGPITEAEFSVSPDVELTVGSTKGKGKQVIPVKEGEEYKISMAVPFVQGKESRQVAVPRRYQVVYPWGWRHGEVDYRSDT